MFNKSEAMQSQHYQHQHADTPPFSSAEEPAFNYEGLIRLGHYLHNSGYRHVAVTPLTHSYNNARPHNQLAHNLRDIFGWSRPFDRRQVAEHEFKLIQDAGVLAPQGELWRSRVRWASLHDLLCAHSAYPTDAEDAVFFGPDTYRFAHLIESWLEKTRHKGSPSRAVDLGCGSGAGAILIARACPDATVSAVDINSKALQMTAANAALAGTANVKPVKSDLLNQLHGEFDLIVANPPYMLDAQQRAYRHGGGTLGEGLSKRIVNAALDRLAPGGTLLLYTGVAIVDGRDPFHDALHHQLQDQPCRWTYREMDPDVFSDELLKPAYAQVERIAAVGLEVTKASA